ncbi:exocyst complex protein exo70 [Acrodontium crateriforme]|uniref:Exocyst complex protein EXO70 n=1 Tax=Acrodontium crateriforme TaxID=150365 RepID=A0AAQ3LXN6_9PEZI|nr:exocyst complex protein exo70 [Acrodontium crateriforme]
MLAPRRAAYAEEAAEVEVLQANLEKMKSLTKKIQSSVARLDVSGRTVQDAIGPIYGNTQRLQITTGNVDKILAAIEKAKQPLDMRNREERILRNRPDKGNLSEYIGSIDRTNQALRDLRASNMRSNQAAISELNGLLTVGTQNLEDIFRSSLRQDSQPIEPVKQITTGKEFPRLSQEKSAELRTINIHISNYAAQSGQSDSLTPSAKAYAQERGQYITMSLQNLSTSTITTARKVNAGSVYRQGSNAIASYAQALEGMYTAEYDNICLIFSREEWGPVLLATCQSSLSAFATTIKELDTHVRSNLITDCYLAYEVIDVVSNTSFQLEERTGELKHPLSDALKPIRETAKSSLSTLLADTRSKSQSVTSLLPDGNALPLTTDVMTRLQLMTAYLPPLTSIMRSLGDGGWAAPNNQASGASIPTLKSFDVGADGQQLFSHYCMDTIEALLNGLEACGRRLLKGRSLQGVFLANNLAVVERMIKSSELDPLLSASQSKLEAWKKKAEQMYLDSWKEPSLHLLDVQYTNKQPRPPSSGHAVDSAAVLKSLSSKDKDVIKEKFKNFNVSFDDLVLKHKTYKMEADVRRQFGHHVQTFIEPLYSRFWERYHEIDKGKGKYVKYDKAQLSAVLASLA